jgi:hypothetical protein
LRVRAPTCSDRPCAAWSGERVASVMLQSAFWNSLYQVWVDCSRSRTTTMW